MKIKDIMNSNVISIDKNTSVLNTALIMQKYDIGFLPIVDNDDIIGVITDRDIVIRALINRIRTNVHASKYMSKDVISINQDNTCEDALTLMKEKKIKRLLVTEKDNLVGIVSFSTIVKHIIDSNFVVESIKVIDKPLKKIDKEAKIDEFKL